MNPSCKGEISFHTKNTAPKFSLIRVNRFFFCVRHALFSELYTPECLGEKRAIWHHHSFSSVFCFFCVQTMLYTYLSRRSTDG